MTMGQQLSVCIDDTHLSLSICRLAVKTVGFIQLFVGFLAGFMSSLPKFGVTSFMQLHTYFCILGAKIKRPHS